jgi:ABC-type bacteriocin/lantibiotic exporter with double-glycine peptidase domain
VELVDVKFRYEKGAPQVVDGISLRIAAGSVVAFTGANGAGKTTTADLLLGILSPESGSIEIDGEPLTANNRQSWQQSLAYVPQQIYLLDASVRDNIALGVATGWWIKRAWRRRRGRRGPWNSSSGCRVGFEEQLGNRGVRLSGGQRQRLGIARALYRSPSLLVLDEATSSLDEDSVQPSWRRCSGCAADARWW